MESYFVNRLKEASYLKVGARWFCERWFCERQPSRSIPTASLHPAAWHHADRRSAERHGQEVPLARSHPRWVPKPCLGVQCFFSEAAHPPLPSPSVSLLPPRSVKDDYDQFQRVNERLMTCKDGHWFKRIPVRVYHIEVFFFFGKQSPGHVRSNSQRCNVPTIHNPCPTGD